MELWWFRQQAKFHSYQLAPFIIFGDSLLDRYNFCLLNKGSKTHFDASTWESSAIDLTLCSPSLTGSFEWATISDLHLISDYIIQSLEDKYRFSNISKRNPSYDNLILFRRARAKCCLGENKLLLHPLLLVFVKCGKNTIDRTLPKTNEKLLGENKKGPF